MGCLLRTGSLRSRHCVAGVPFGAAWHPASAHHGLRRHLHRGLHHSADPRRSGHDGKPHRCLGPLPILAGLMAPIGAPHRHSSGLRHGVHVGRVDHRAHRLRPDIRRARRCPRIRGPDCRLHHLGHRCRAGLARIGNVATRGPFGRYRSRVLRSSRHGPVRYPTGD